MPAAVELAAADRDSRNASLTLALAQPGDTLLYVLLPLHHDVFGVSLAEAGLLLAANRLVRIAGYGWVARFYAEQGPKASCLLAVTAAALATFGYALSTGIWVLLVARLLWGLSFAAMNIATQALATAESSGAARRSGRMRAIIAAGPVSGLIGGAVIAQLGGPRLSFLILGAIALLAFPFAIKLPKHGEGRPARLPRPRFGLPARLDIWSFIQGVTLDGLFVLGMSVLAAAAVPGYAALAAGGTLGLRYIAEILLAPVGGALAHRCAAGADPALDRQRGRIGHHRFRVVMVRRPYGRALARPDSANTPADCCQRVSGAGTGAGARQPGNLARSRRRRRPVTGGDAAADHASCLALRRGCTAPRPFGRGNR
jgi:MFS family permease